MVTNLNTCLDWVSARLVWAEKRPGSVESCNTSNEENDRGSACADAAALENMSSPDRQRGSTLPEVLATVGVIGILMAVAALGLNRGFVGLESSHQELVNSVREIRLQATVRGAHYRLTPFVSLYEIARLQDADADGLWDNDASFPVRLVNLPAGISISGSSASGGDGTVEFNTRGVAVDSLGGGSEVVQLVLTDSDGTTRLVEVWPSGQVRTEPLVGLLP